MCAGILPTMKTCIVLAAALVMALGGCEVVSPNTSGGNSIIKLPGHGRFIFFEDSGAIYAARATDGSRTRVFGKEQADWSHWAADMHGSGLAWVVPGKSPKGGIWVDDGNSRRRVVHFDTDAPRPITQIRLNVGDNAEHLRALYVLEGRTVTRYSLMSAEVTKFDLPMEPSHFSIARNGQGCTFDVVVNDPSGPNPASFLKSEFDSSIIRLNPTDIPSIGSVGATHFGDLTYWLEQRPDGRSDIMYRSGPPRVALPSAIVGAALPHSLTSYLDGTGTAWISDGRIWSYSAKTRTDLGPAGTAQRLDAGRTIGS
jgi:hypothetical protein